MLITQHMLAFPSLISYLLDSGEFVFEAGAWVWMVPGRWTGPSDIEIDPFGMLRIALPPERWPYGPPEHHEPTCWLRESNGARGAFCDCAASDASDEDWGAQP